ncbi:MAG: hypothetical protein AB7I27_01100 [Bacteriovoracaceae bacterium]
MQIKVKGLASERVTELEVPKDELESNLLFWLRKKGITIASSCDGEGICKKCVIQDDLLSCKLTISAFLKLYPTGIIEITYL